MNEKGNRKAVRYKTMTNIFKRNNKNALVKVTYKYDNEETIYTTTMTEKALAGAVVNDAYIEIIKVEKI